MEIILASKSPRRQELLKMLGFDFQILTIDIDEQKIQNQVLDYFQNTKVKPDSAEYSKKKEFFSSEYKFSFLVEKLASEKSKAVLQKLTNIYRDNVISKDRILHNYTNNMQEEILKKTNISSEKANQITEIPARIVDPKNVIVLAADTIVCLENEILGKPKDKPDAIRMLEFLSGKTHQVYTGVAIYHKDSVKSFYEKADVTFCRLDAFQKQYIKKYVASGDPLDKAGAYGIQGPGSVLIERINGDFFTIMGLPVQRVYRELVLLDSEY